MVRLFDRCLRRVRRARGTLGRAAVLGLAALALTPPARAQIDAQEPILLPETISDSPIEMRARFARQWRQADGTLTVMFNGGFRLDMGRRRLSADDAVVWVRSERSEPDGRKFYDVTVYLSGNAQVQDVAGTITEDQVLLISSLRTFGQITKHHDAHSREPAQDSPLYQRAVQDRQRIFGPVPQTQPAPKTHVPRPESTGEPKVKRPGRTIRYTLPSIETAQTPDGGQVFVVIGQTGARVYFSQAGGPDSPLLEIQADNAVVFPKRGTASLLVGEELTEPQTRPATTRPAPPTRPGPQQPPARLSDPLRSSGIEAIYLEGDVVLSLGTRFVRASRLYYDFERSRALILDAVFRTDIPQRGIPLYIRADQIRQLSAREFSATNARVSTSEFYTPHYHVGADKVYIEDRTERNAAGEPAGRIAATYELRNTTLNVQGFPIAYWPRSRGDLETSETVIRRLRTGYSDEFGVEIETSWHLYNLLGIPRPQGFDATLKLDYFTDRGPGLGVDSDYEREDYYGLFRSYFLSDKGRDNLGPLRDNEPDTPNRGRVLWRHRHFLPNDWEATLEVSYLSDPSFLETFERSEFFEGKQQETLFYLKRAREVDAITLLANWRLLDFVTQTEHLPDLTYRRIGDTFAEPLTLYHESRIGVVRYRADDRRFFDDDRLDNTSVTDATFRGDIRQEAELPIKLGPLNVVPFATLRGSFWDGVPRRAGALWRGFGLYGLRGGTSFSRVFDDVESELLDIHRIRHVVKPEFAAWWSHSNARSTFITPFDEGLETIDDFYGFLLALRQTWQTKRGAADGERTVDLLRLDLEAGLFGDRQVNENSNGYVNPFRPEDSRTRNYLSGELVYRLSDTTNLLYDFNVDLNDWAFDRHNVALAVERLPRLAYVFGLRHAGDINLTLIGGGWNYKLTEKHITAVRAWHDIDGGEFGEIAVAYIRKLPRWYFGVNFEYDRVDDDISISISFWPEGIPEWTLGSRRFTGLTTSTGIRP